MIRTVFNTVFTLILLMAIAVLGVDAWPGVEVVDGSARISASASTLAHAPTGNILKKYRRAGGQWVFIRRIEAEWLCRVRMQVKFRGFGNASVAAEGQTVNRATGDTFETLSPDAETTRISSYFFLNRSEPLEMFATARGTVKTDNENEVGGYKGTGKGYYEISHGGDGIGLSVTTASGSLALSGIDAATRSMPLDERHQPRFDIAIQCDPAAACSGNSSPPPPVRTTQPKGQTVNVNKENLLLHTVATRITQQVLISVFSQIEKYEWRWNNVNSTIPVASRSSRCVSRASFFSL